jgi:YbbR domain-containing protein
VDTLHAPETTSAMVAQATVAAKVNSKNAVLVHQAQGVRVVTHDQVAMRARAETHVQLAILADLTALHLVTHEKIVTSVTTVVHLVRHVIAMSATTAVLLVRLVNVLIEMIAELRLLGGLALKVIVVPLVRASMN